MKQLYLIVALALLFGQPAVTAGAQDVAAPGSTSPPAPARPPAAGRQQQPPPRATGFDLSDYGVGIEPEPRLIVVLAALDAAGFDPAPAGAEETSLFRQMLKRDLAGLDPELRKRLQAFYERHKLPAPATPAEQAARYVSLAFALGAPPNFDAPQRTDDLPAGVLEVLDFAPLVRDFYRRSGIDERLPSYLRSYRAEGDRLRRSAGEMVRTVLSYLHTRPITTIIERIPVKSPAPAEKKKKDAPPMFTTREKSRRFFIVPDLLAVPGAINFRVIGDDYYAVVPYGSDPATSEVRRAYLSYLIDPLVARFNRDIAARRDAIKQLIDERAKAGQEVAPDVFGMVTRSLIAATDARLTEAARLRMLARDTSVRLRSAGRDTTQTAAISKESQEVRAAIEDVALAQLADAYERGALLAFYFAEQLRGLESSGFDITNLFSDMVASFDPARETRQPAEYRAVRERAAAARQRLQAAFGRAGEEAAAAAPDDTASPRAVALVKGLREAEQLLRLKNYEEAETRLRAMMQEFQGEPRIFFALGLAASLAAQDAFDENLQADRLNRALANYRFAVQAASGDTDRALLSHAHAAMGRILAFLERNEEALREFNAAIEIGDVAGGAYTDAVNGKNRLAPPK